MSFPDVSYHTSPGLIALFAFALTLTGCDGLFGDLDEVADNQPQCEDDADLFGGGDGTAADPFRICTAQHLDTMADDEAFMAEELHFRLHRDIELSGNFSGIGSPDFHESSDIPGFLSEDEPFAFQGSFDGNEHTIDGLRMDGLKAGIGFVRHLGPDGRISDLVLSNVDIKGVLITGPLVGYNEGSITNCQVQSGRVDVDSQADRGVISGGLVGANMPGASIADSSTDVDVVAHNLVGGLVGANETVEGARQAALITDSSAHGQVSSSGDINDLQETHVRMAGGLVGANAGRIERSFASGPVETEGTIRSSQSMEFIGGLVGANAASATISESASLGSVDARSELRSTTDGGLALIGALVGANSGEISDSFALGNARFTGQIAEAGIDIIVPSNEEGVDVVGGLVGSHITEEDHSAPPIPTITNCYAIGTVQGRDLEGQTFLGGLVAVSGDADTGTEPVIESSYWDRTTSRTTEGEGQSLETDKFGDEGQFEGWDFDTTWTIAEAPDGESRPVLQWQFDD